jgi:hypothetical protein
MKIKTFVKVQMTDKIGEYIPVSEVAYEYVGPLALADRAASSRAKDAADTSATTAGNFGSNAGSEHAELTPFYSSEMHAEHGYDPNQINEMLTYAGAGAGGAAGSITGQAGLEAARTRNASGFTKALDEAARDKDKASAGLSEGVAAQDVMGAKQLNQEGAAGMAGLYGEDVNGQLKAMGLENEDINTELQAGKSGWLQNMNDTLSTLAKTGSAAYPKGFQG